CPTGTSPGPGNRRAAARPRRRRYSRRASLDLPESLLDVPGVGRAHQLRRFLAVAQEDERRPELDGEGAAEALAAGVGHLDVAHVRVRAERLGDERLRAAAMAAPGAAELEQGGAGQ